MAVAATASPSCFHPSMTGSIEQSLRNWQYTGHLTDEKIQLVVQEILNYFKECPSRETPPHLIVEAKSISCGVVKALCSKTKEGDPVVYLSSNVEGVIARFKANGSFKVISQGLEIIAKEEGVSVSFVALVKPLKESLLMDKDNFEKEAVLLERCKNLPGLIRLRNLVSYPKGEISKMRMVLPWYAGGDLIDSQHRLTESESIAVCQQILTILAGIERAGWVFRDVKSDNILLNYKEGGGIEVVLCDPGFMHSVSDPSASCELIGTPAWLAPEYACLYLESAAFLEKGNALEKRRLEVENRKDEEGFNYEQELQNHLAQEAVFKRAEKDFLETKNKKLREWTTSKLDVWSAGLICAFFLRSSIWNLLKKGLEDHNSLEALQRSMRWHKRGSITGIARLYPGDPLAELITQMLHPDPRCRLSLMESCEKFCELLAAGRINLNR